MTIFPSNKATGNEIWRQFCVVWHDDNEWTYAIDPECPVVLRDFVRREATALCEELIANG